MKIAVVTGGGHGIGRALCRRLHRDGMHVVVADIEGDAARTVAEEIDGLAREIDVTDEAAMVAMIDDIESNVGPIELFISNAGVAFGDGKSGSISREGGLVPIDERWEPSWQINVMAHVYAD
jgi:NAD(P)-dependent dehydrogenase (short-subunit alcohol dehydrogenase family)